MKDFTTNLYIFFLFFLPSILFCQQNINRNYFGFEYAQNENCFNQNYSTPTDYKLEKFISEILKIIGTKNGIKVKNCEIGEYFAAQVKDGIPFLLYNEKKISNVNFQFPSINDISSNYSKLTIKDWNIITILAHEIGHHINGHLLNQSNSPSYKQIVLEADEFSGFIINLLGGTIENAQLAILKAILPTDLDFIYPNKKERLSAIKRGYDNTSTKGFAAINNNFQELFTAMDVEGRKYKTVKIGNQIWMAENLKTSKYTNGDIISNVYNGNIWKDLTKGAWTWYKNDKNYESVTGKLYNGYAIKDVRGLCPIDWRVPSDQDWQIMVDYLGGDLLSGFNLKSNFGWDLEGSGSNLSDFNALPGGSRKNNGIYIGSGEFADWWSSTLSKSGTGYGRSLSSNHNMVYRGEYSHKYGFSVRCIKE